MKKRRYALDLFCGAGGATRGLQQAGFYVVGVDVAPQPRYVGDEFIQEDVFRQRFDWARFDLVWASPPCQAHTSLRSMHNAKTHISLVAKTRRLLVKSAKLRWVIENVPGAPLRTPRLLCGTMFDLGYQDAQLWRHRLFESNFAFDTPSCVHRKGRVIGVYGGHGRDHRRRINAQDFSTEARREAMGIDWMTGTELSQAIPPAYSKYIALKVLP